MYNKQQKEKLLMLETYLEELFENEDNQRTEQEEYNLSLMSKVTVKWTFDICVASALKYKTKKDWSEGENGACRAARRNKWVDECCEHMM